MNDNELPKHDWCKLIEQEWGYRPLSCEADELNPKTIRAVFERKINVGGYMQINGYTIVPRVLVMPEPFYPSAQRRAPFRALRADQNTLAFK